jgi:hypothetical protein
MGIEFGNGEGGIGGLNRFVLAGEEAEEDFGGSGGEGLEEGWGEHGASGLIRNAEFRIQSGGSVLTPRIF